MHYYCLSVISYSGNYGSPRGFCFDVLCHDDLLLNMSKTALLDKVNVFLNELKVQSDRTKGNHILLTMGEDFNVSRQAVMVFDMHFSPL